MVRFIQVRLHGGGVGEVRGDAGGLWRYRVVGVTSAARVTEPPRQESSARPPVCVHCKKRAGYRPRTLCCFCYCDKAIRALYPLGNGENGREGRCFYRSKVGRKVPRKLPARPTSAMPGSAEKVEVLRERAGKGEILWHPLDSCMDPKGPELT